jgi:protein-S-isoprenylcysteine O-methyltransferase Ste14
MNGTLATLLSVIAYGILHSLLASPWAKYRARKTFGPNADKFYRLLYNAIGVITLLPVLVTLAMKPGDILYRLSWPWVVLAFAGQGAALLLLAIGLLQTDLWHFLGLRQILQPQTSAEPTLVVTGLYRWVRHPLYTLGLVFLWLTPVMTSSLLVFNLGMSVYIYVGSIFEERRLRDEFGLAYADYQRRVPRLLPQPWRKPIAN